VVIVQDPKTDIVLHQSDDALALARSELIALGKRADEAADAAVPANTRRAYELELYCFASWCTRHGIANVMPASPSDVRAYLFELADRGRHPDDLPKGKGRPKGPMAHSALQRTLAAICRSHRKSGYASLWLDPLITEARSTLARLKGTAPKKQKRDIGAVGEGLLFKVCDLISDDVRGIRDRALILVGWQGGGRRRSEIVAAHAEHFVSVEGGIQWTIPRSKADQTGKGLVVALTPASDERYCPVRALRRWLAVSKIERGPVFRGVDMMTGAVMAESLAPEGVSRRVKHYVAKLGLDPADFGGHSLRSGFVTTAYKMGRPIFDIKKSTGHNSTREMEGYIRRAGLIEESAGRGLIDESLASRPLPSVPASTPAPEDQVGEIRDPEGLLSLIPDEPKRPRPRKGAS
jgi:integrase